MLLVKATSGGNDLTLLALREARLPIVTVAVEGYLGAVEFFERTGRYVEWDGHDPELLLVCPSLDGPERTDLITRAKPYLEKKPCPIVLLVGEANDDELREWYSLGVNSVVPVTDESLMPSVHSICHYWLVHNRTPQ